MEPGPAQYLTDTLGAPPPPLDPRREDWLTASAAISRYRLEHHIPPDTPDPLGNPPAPGRFRERLDYQHAETVIRPARDTLGLPTTPERQPGRSREREPDGYEP